MLHKVTLAFSLKAAQAEFIVGKSLEECYIYLKCAAILSPHCFLCFISYAMFEGQSGPFGSRALAAIAKKKRCKIERVEAIVVHLSRRSIPQNGNANAESDYVCVCVPVCVCNCQALTINEHCAQPRSKTLTLFLFLSRRVVVVAATASLHNF